jgi:hypothetical protein
MSAHPRAVHDDGIDDIADALAGRVAVENAGQVGGGEVADLVPGRGGG